VAKGTFSAKDLERFKQQLIDQLTGLFRSVHGEVRDGMVREMFDEDQPRDEGDESLRVQLRDARMSLAENEARRAQEMEAALRRIREGPFGICVDCGQPIEKEPLKLVPWAARCIEDQSELERRQREHAPTL
jgi:DnaK suppressor protein